MRMMRLVVSASIFCALLAASVDARQEKSIPELSKCLATITAKDVEAGFEVLTSDECAGRDTGQSGLYEAIEYVEKVLGEAKLEPFGSAGGGFRQAYTLDGYDIGATSTLEVDGGQGAYAALALRTDFVPARNSGNGAAEGELVFAGYGIEEKDHRWNDYAKIDVKRRIAVVLAGEPRQDRDDKKFFDGKELTENASLAKKAALAQEKGAVALLVVAASEAQARLLLGAQLPVVGGGQRQALPIPVAVVSGPALSTSLGVDFAALRTSIDDRRATDSKSLAPARAKLDLTVTSGSVTCHNVVARFPAKPGSKLSDEVVIVGAHIDHLGVDDRGRIYRGAEDNAGGTITLLEVASALGKVKPFTERAIVLVFFSGEEKGLLGSAAFVKDPPVAVDKMYAMINLDMFARGRPKAFEATRPSETTMLNKLLPTAVKLSGSGLKVGDGGKQFFERSDHFNFHKVGVPTIFFNEGETSADYHRWTDTTDKVLPNKVAGVAKVTLALAALAANSSLKGGLR